MPPLAWFKALTAVALLAGPLPCARSQSLIMSDGFESPTNAINPALWPYAAATRIETGQTFFGTNNHYFHISGAGVRALSANWSSALGGQPATFAFDYFEPANSGDSFVVGYAAGTSDINTAGAFVRITLGGGVAAFDAADGTTLTNSSTTSYPRDTRLTFSLALNDTSTSQPFQGTNLPPKTLAVCCYNWANQQSIHVLSIDVSASTRTPVCVGFRTWSTSTNAQAFVDNVKLIDRLIVVTPDFVPAAPPVAPVIPPRPLAHPCVFNSQEELDRLKYRINHDPASPAVAGWNQMRASPYASLNYLPVPYSNVVVMGSGTTPSESQFRQDAHAARAAALQWVVTGAAAYRDKAIGILNAWASNFVTMSPAAGTSTAQIQLEAAWVAPIWVSAADLIRYYNGGVAGWSAADIAKFDVMLNYLHGRAALTAGANNNWGASAALTMIAVGAYQDNPSRFNSGVQTWRDRLDGINAAVNNNGYIYEVCRDTTHPQYTLQVWMQAAEIAWKQGIDLFRTTMNDRTIPQFAINLENFADLFLGLSLPPCSDSFLTNYSYFGKQSQSGAYDIAYNHYLLRAGLTNLPHYADLILNHWRPGGWDEHFCSWSTLTHGDLSAGLPQATALGLWNTASNVFTGALADGDTLNIRALAGFAAAAQTTGVVSGVQFYTNGVVFGPIVTNAPFFLPSWPPPGNYFLCTLASQNLPDGSIPGDRFTRFVRVVDLPAGWALHDPGAPSVPAWASESNGSFTLNAAGTNVAGVSDQFGWLSVNISGDLQLTARLASLTTTGSTARAGIMVRDGLVPDAPHVFLALGPPGADLATLAARLATQGPTIATNLAVPSGPLWLRLTRFANFFTAYYSADGRHWTACGAGSVPMNTVVRAGLAVASGASGQTAAAAFDSVLVEPLSAAYDDWQRCMFTQRGVTNVSLAAPQADADNDGRSNLAEYWLGSDPLTPDSEPSVGVIGMAGGPLVRLRFAERKNAADLGRKFQISPDLVNWSVVAPAEMSDLEDLGSVVIREVDFSAPGSTGFYRAVYGS